MLGTFPAASCTVSLPAVPLTVTLVGAASRQRDWRPPRAVPQPLGRGADRRKPSGVDVEVTAPDSVAVEKMPVSGTPTELPNWYSDRSEGGSAR